MQTQMMFSNPDDIQITLKVTMTAKEWDTIRGQMSNRSNSEIMLNRAITDAFVQIRKIVYVNQNEE